ncbi:MULTISPECIES: ATP-binding cassette domain-containing protein [Desulfosediminicola]|uniref:ATP-binding cassette domain-containing protein n=1 Tax=Desulfosediminicola TaxID=2886823 RepID=UPI00159474BA
MRPIIEIEHLDKNFGNFNALCDINLTMYEKEVIVIVGPSGSGKSTLIRCINYLEKPTAGKILLDEYPIEDGPKLPDIRADIGMVFQSFNLFPHMTILKNVAQPTIRVRHLGKAEAEERAMMLLEKVGLQDHIHKYPDQLSGGQQQRVAIARAMAMKPRVLLFDEPTSALDPEMVGEVLEVMQNLAAEGVSMIVVTHEMGFARKVADRVLFMETGRILVDETPENFFDNSTNERLRTFQQAVQNH